MDLVSIVVIGYNVEKTIAECLSSIQKQSYMHIEILFIDDGSVDNTANIVKSLSNSDDRIKYIYQKNQGANVARKKGFKNTTGKYVMFVDGDDLLVKDAVLESVNEQQSEEYDFVCFDYSVFENDMSIILEKHPYKNGEFREYEYLYTILKRQQAHYLWNKIYRRDFLEKMRFEEIPSITMGDDFAANVRMGICKPRVKAISFKAYLYRKNMSSVSRKPNEKYIELLSMLEDVESQVIRTGQDEEIKKLLDYNYFLTFYYYVVRNKYKYLHYQKAIYNTWKNRKVNIQDNTYIVSFINNKSIVDKVLIYIINFSDFFEKAITEMYALVKKY